MDNIYGPSEEMEQNEINAPVEEYNNKLNETQNNLMSSESNESSGPSGSSGSSGSRRSRRLGMCGLHRYYHMYSVFHAIVGLFAIYLSFRCNRGINVIDLLFAFFCPVLYIIYRTAVCNEMVSEFRVINVRRP